MPMQEARAEALEELGYHRLNVLYCLQPPSAVQSPLNFNPPDGANVSNCFREYLLNIFEIGSRDYVQLIAAAGLMTYGRLDMVCYVLDNLPQTPIHTDHYAGRCIVLPYVLAAVVLPLPEDLRRGATWVGVEWAIGTRSSERVRNWFLEHRHRLRWEENQRHGETGHNTGSFIVAS